MRETELQQCRRVCRQVVVALLQVEPKAEADARMLELAAELILGLCREDPLSAKQALVGVRQRLGKSG